MNDKQDTIDKYNKKFIKRLAPDYAFMSYGYRIYLNEEPSDEREQKINIIQRMLCLIKKKVLELWKITETMPEPIVEPIPTPVEPEQPKYEWATPQQARHSVRVICDEEGLSWNEKQDVSSTVNCESGFHIRAKNINTNGSYDAGIVQANSTYWIGKGKKFPSEEYVYEHPEECVRWMCREWRTHNYWWICYKTGKYKNYKA